MTKWISGLLTAGLLTGVAAVPALAQHRDSHRPQVGRQMPHPVKYREVSMSRGHKWRRGQRIAANQRRFVVNDWNRRGLRAPPRGYQWVRENNNSGDFLLVAAATGLIASILSQ